MGVGLTGPGLTGNVRDTETFAAVVRWGDVKDWLSDSLHLSHGILHVHVGMAVFLLGAVLLRRPVGTWTPLLIVVVLELLNEAVDFARYQMSGWPWRPGPTIADLVATWLWPIVLTLVFRHALRRAAVVEPAPDPG